MRFEIISDGKIEKDFFDLDTFYTPTFFYTCNPNPNLNLNHSVQGLNLSSWGLPIPSQIKPSSFSLVSFFFKSF